MNKEFIQAVAALQQTTKEFAEGRVSPVAHSDARNAALCAAVVSMAKDFDVDLQPIYTIDSRGELRIVAKNGDQDPRLGCGHFGAPFAAWLNKANPRTGVMPGAIMAERDGWCYINHFSAEKMVLDYFKENT